MTSAADQPRSNPRFGQMFPTLSDKDIERLGRFGAFRRFEDGEQVSRTGKPGAGMVVVLSGRIAVTQRDGLGHVTPVIDHRRGQFLGEVGQLSGWASLVDARARGRVEALVLPPAKLRDLLVAEAELGERVMRALILRRVGLIQSGVGGPLLVGSPSLPAVMRLQTFLSRNGLPFHILDPDTDAEAAALVAASPTGLSDLPWVVCADGTILHDPRDEEVATAIGMIGSPSRKEAFDVAIVGAGPAGLAAAVYGSSEGLSVAVLDARAFGGQAGASARIENYLGFPTGISGQALAGRAFVQAQKFGAEMMIPATVSTLACEKPDGFFGLDLQHGDRVRARSIVIASGASYRRPHVPDLADYEGRGVWYWASPIEARSCGGEEVIIVGGGNSAGQAAVFLSGVAAKVHVMVRGEGLAATMSRYLVDRIAATANIALHTRTELVELRGTADHGLEGVRWRNNETGVEGEARIRNIFVFVGADPATSWLAGCGVELDSAGFVATRNVGAGRSNALETSVPGVFAIGDVRSGSVKRVGNAIGEGAQVVAALHEYLSGSLQPTA